MDGENADEFIKETYSQIEEALILDINSHSVQYERASKEMNDQL